MESVGPKQRKFCLRNSFFLAQRERYKFFGSFMNLNVSRGAICINEFIQGKVGNVREFTHNPSLTSGI